jgi:hypothetical protein
MAYGATGAWTGIMERPFAWIMFLSCGIICINQAWESGNYVNATFHERLVFLHDL